MTTPVLQRTWQFQVNTNNPALDTATATNQALMYAIKEAFKGNGAWTDSAGAATASSGNWVVDYSCDSVVAGTPNDGVDRWAAAGNLVWGGGANPRSWIVLRQTGIATNFELLIYLDSVSSYQATIVVSPSAGFTGGTTTTRPTATDEIVLIAGNSWGGASVNAASFLHVIKTSAGEAIRVAICRNGQIGGFWFFEQPGTPIDGWSEPSVSCVLVGDPSGTPTTMCTFANLSNAASVWGYSQNPISHYLTGLCTRAHGMLPSNQTVASEIPAEYPFFEQGVYSETVYGRGRNGKMVDQWWGLAALADTDTYPLASRDFVQLGDVIWPWNTTAPSFGGGVSTARAGDLVVQSELWFEDYLPPTAGSPDAETTSVGATLQYQMEAWDSVTGAQFTWLSDVRDFAGVGYPGPNLPVDIAVSTKVEG